MIHVKNFLHFYGIHSENPNIFKLFFGLQFRIKGELKSQSRVLFNLICGPLVLVL